VDVALTETEARKTIALVAYDVLLVDVNLGRCAWRSASRKDGEHAFDVDAKFLHEVGEEGCPSTRR
jgi:hypothetical protein